LRARGRASSAGKGAGPTSRTRFSCLRCLATSVSTPTPPGREGGQARPAEACLRRPDRSGAHGVVRRPAGRAQALTRPAPEGWVMPRDEPPPAGGPSSRRFVGQATDLAVAQAVEDEREELAGHRGPRLV